MARAIQDRRGVLDLWQEGHSKKSIARTTGIPRSTVRDWIHRFAGVAQSAEAAGLKSAQWGFESLHQHQLPHYAYLLGMYFGDGHISRMPRTYRLRVYLNRNQLEVIARTAKCIAALIPSGRVGFVVRGRCAEVVSYSASWPRIFPQSGPGRKHARVIVLDPWQREIVEGHPEYFIAGCLESDGCRHRRVVNGENYPAYLFYNRSSDILRLFTWACDLIGIHYTLPTPTRVSIARREDVTRVDAIMARL